MNILKHYLKWLLLTPFVLAGVLLLVGVFVFAIVGWTLPALGYTPWWVWFIWWACAAALIAFISYDFEGDMYDGYDGQYDR